MDCLTSFAVTAVFHVELPMPIECSPSAIRRVLSRPLAPVDMVHFQTRLANQNDIPALSRLFDNYRQFYEQAPDLAQAAAFISQRMAQQESVIFVAEAKPSELAGFCQLYPTFCSVLALPIYSISISIRHVVASPCRAQALSAASRLMSYRSKNAITRCTTCLLPQVAAPRCGQAADAGR